jgi:hypothetical protein
LSSGERFDIAISGTTTGTTPVPVRMRFTGSDAAAGFTSTTPVITQVPLGAPCDKTQEFHVHLDVPRGTPAAPFTMSKTGGYEIDDELLAADEPTGAAVRVFGTVAATRAPAIAVFPVYFSSAPAADIASLKSAADTLVDDANHSIPDYFPLAPGAMHIAKEAPVDITDAVNAGVKQASSLIVAASSAFSADLQKAYQQTLRQARADAVGAQLTRLLSLDSALGSGTRAVVVLRDVDYAALDPTPAPQLYHSLGSAGFAASQKVIILTKTYLSASALAHELAHTLPYPWLADEPECGRRYHNADGHFAHGVRITLNGSVTTPEVVDVDSIMGGGTRAGRTPPPTWIDQCTYAHLIGYLDNPPDPHAVLVQGLLARAGDSEVGALLPAYTLDSPVDLTADGPGDHAVVVRSADGSELSRYPFSVTWQTYGHPDPSTSAGPVDHVIRYFAYRVPQAAGASSIAVVGPDGRDLAHLTLGSQAPRLNVSAPQDGATVASDATTADVRWHADTTGGTTAVSTVLYSADGGRSFSPVIVESPVWELSVHLAPQGDHVIKIVVSDGGRSATVVIHLRSRAGSLPWLLIGGGVLIVGAAGGVTVLARRRRKPTLSG